VVAINPSRRPVASADPKPSESYQIGSTAPHRVERYEYTAYGVTTILDPTATTVRATSSFGNPYMYTGRRLDSEFASSSEDTLYYYRARYYDPNQGRFIGRDPLGYFDSNNLYLYSKSMPVKAKDPTGTTTILNDRPTPAKCHYVSFILDVLSSTNPVDNLLWDHYRGGSGKDLIRITHDPCA